MSACPVRCVPCTVEAWFPPLPGFRFNMPCTPGMHGLGLVAKATACPVAAAFQHTNVCWLLSAVCCAACCLLLQVPHPFGPRQAAGIRDHPVGAHLQLRVSAQGAPHAGMCTMHQRMLRYNAIGCACNGALCTVCMCSWHSGWHQAKHSTLAAQAPRPPAACCCHRRRLQAGMLPAFLPALDAKFKELFGMTSFALSLLLVFRTNASYGRWDEARKMWGMVLNRTRDICRLVGAGWGSAGQQGAVQWGVVGKGTAAAAAGVGWGRREAGMHACHDSFHSPAATVLKPAASFLHLPLFPPPRRASPGSLKRSGSCGPCCAAGPPPFPRPSCATCAEGRTCAKSWRWVGRERGWRGGWMSGSVEW